MPFQIVNSRRSLTLKNGDKVSFKQTNGIVGKFKNWLRTTWLGRRMTIGAIKIKGEEGYLDKTSLAKRISSFIIPDTVGIISMLQATTVMK